MSIKFNEEDFISCSEFKCEQDYNDFVKAVENMGYSVYEPNYHVDVISGCYKSMMFDGEDFTSATAEECSGKEYTLEYITRNYLSEEAQVLRKMLLQAVKDVEDGRLTSIDDFLEKL